MKLTLFAVREMASNNTVWKHLKVEIVRETYTFLGMAYNKVAPAQVAHHSLLIKWLGSNPALNPVLFVSHLDVVPATEGSSSEWSRPPFGGEVHDK